MEQGTAQSSDPLQECVDGLNVNEDEIESLQQGYEYGMVMLDILKELEGVDVANQASQQVSNTIETYPFDQDHPAWKDEPEWARRGTWLRYMVIQTIRELHGKEIVEIVMEQTSARIEVMTRLNIYADLAAEWSMD